MKELTDSARDQNEVMEFARRAQVDLIDMYRHGEISARDYAIAMEEVNDILGVKTPEAADKASKSFIDFAKEASQGIQDNFSDALVDGMNGTFDGLATAFKGTLDRMFADFLAHQIAKMLFGGEFAAGDTSGGFGGIFGGFMASGGPVAAGTSYMVGEKGPELFTPSVGGMISPNGESGGTTNINITAIDGPSVKQLFEREGRSLAEIVNGNNRTYNLT